MTLTITLQPELEARFREQAMREGLTMEQAAARRMEEAELLWRIHTASPEGETRELHRLLRRNRSGNLNADEQSRLQTLLDEREERAAQRLADLGKLSLLRGVPVRSLMEQLGIRPSLHP